MALVQASEKVKCSALRFYVLFLPLAASLVGCKGFLSAYAPKPPSAQIATASGTQLAQTGAAQVPAAASVDTTSIEIPLSAFVTPGRDAGISVNRVTPKPESRDPVTLQTESAAALRITTRRETASGPQAFAPPAPPKPPTPTEQAAADLFKWAGLVSLGLIIVAGLLLWAQHYLAALKIAAAAVALPVLARFFGSGVAIAVTVGLVALGAGLWLAWGILKRKVSSGQNPFTAS